MSTIVRPLFMAFFTLLMACTSASSDWSSSKSEPTSTSASSYASRPPPKRIGSATPFSVITMMCLAVLSARFAAMRSRAGGTALQASPMFGSCAAHRSVKVVPTSRKSDGLPLKLRPRPTMSSSALKGAPAFVCARRNLSRL